MVVLSHRGPSAVVRVNRRRGVPAESESAQIIAAGIEVHQVALGIVVTIPRAKQDGAIGRYRGRCRRIVYDAAIARLICQRIDAQQSAGAASARSAVGRKPASIGHRNAATIVETVAQRGNPLQAEIGIQRYQEGIAVVEVRAADSVNGPVGSDRWRYVQPGALATAG